MSKTPGLNLPYGIDPVNPVPVDSNYGPYASVAAAKAAIPVGLRYDGLTVQITGSGNYWWLAADLSDSGLIAKGGGGGGNTPVPITYVALVALQSGGTLSPGTTYNITDRDLGIYVKAISNTQIDKMAVRVMLTPKFDTSISADMWGCWYSDMANYFPISIGNYVVWGGQVWTNVNGNTGTAIDQLTLDAEWTLVPKGLVDDQYYGIVVHNIEYDLITDLVIKQWDNLGNIVGPVTLSTVTTLGYNPCDITNWLQFKDASYTYAAGLNGFDFNIICFNNKFTEGFFLPTIDAGVGYPNYIANNTNFTVRGALIYYAYMLGCTNVSIVAPDNYSLSYIFNSQNVSLNSFPTNAAGNEIYVDSVINFTADASRLANIYRVRDTYCTNVNIGISDPVLNIDFSEYCGLQNITINTFSNNKHVKLLNGAYTTIEYVQSLPGIDIAPTSEVVRDLNDFGNTLYQYLEIGPAPLIGPGVSKYYQSIVTPNTRLVDAKIISALTGSVGVTAEFGVEDDAVGYLPSALLIDLAASPQSVSTISNILTVGKRYYLKNTAGSGSISNGSNTIRIWLTLIKY